MDFRNSSWSIARLKNYLKRKRGYSRLPFKKPELLERQVSLNRHLAYILRVQTLCQVFQVQPEKNKSLLAQTSPALQPLPLAFSQLPIVSDLIICPKGDGVGQTSRFLSMRLRASYSRFGEIGGRKENTDGIAPTFGKCLALLGFKQLLMEESTSF